MQRCHADLLWFATLLSASPLNPDLEVERGCACEGNRRNRGGIDPLLKKPANPLLNRERLTGAGARDDPDPVALVSSRPLLYYCCLLNLLWSNPHCRKSRDRDGTSLRLNLIGVESRSLDLDHSGALSLCSDAGRQAWGTFVLAESRRFLCGS